MILTTLLFGHSGPPIGVEEKLHVPVPAAPILRGLFGGLSGDDKKLLFRIYYEFVNLDALVKSLVSPPLVGGD